MQTATTTSAEIARMLRDLQRRVRIRPSLLASRVQSALGVPSINAAVETLLDSALRNVPASDAALLRAIVAHECVPSAATRAQLAAKLRMSERSFYRRRQEALFLLQQEIEALLAPKETPDPMAPILTLIADYDPASELNTDPRVRAVAGHNAETTRERPSGLSALEYAFRGDLEEVRKSLGDSSCSRGASDEEFWREEARFISGRCSGAFADMESAAQRMQRLLPALSTEYQIETYLYMSELLMYRGRLVPATHYVNMASGVLQPHRSIRHRLTVLLRTGQIALTRGDNAAAYEAASVVTTAARHHFDLKARGTFVLARASSGRPLPAIDTDSHGSQFYEACFMSMMSRQYLTRGAYEDAWHMAQAAFQLADARGYGYQAARSAAALHLCLRATAPSERGPWAVEALRRHIQCGNNRYVAVDMFDIGLPDSPLDEYLIAQLAGLYAELHSNSGVADDPHLLQAILHHVAVSGDAPTAELTRDFGRVLARVPFAARKALLQDMEEFLEAAVALTKQPGRSECLRRWKHRLTMLANMAIRDVARRRGSALVR